VHPANIQDRDGAKTLLSELTQFYPRMKKVWADGGYAGQLEEWAATEAGLTLEIVSRPPEAQGFVPLPRRWIVERTFGWFNGYRRLSKDYEATTDSSETVVYLAMINLMLHRLAPE
jgi:putative transposase